VEDIEAEEVLSLRALRIRLGFDFCFDFEEFKDTDATPRNVELVPPLLLVLVIFESLFVRGLYEVAARFVERG
tara:strand:- start:562 stop:780 length:219 start_codon:yes stop_codon:yes gene_type:complete